MGNQSLVPRQPGRGLSWDPPTCVSSPASDPGKLRWQPQKPQTSPQGASL